MRRALLLMVGLFISAGCALEPGDSQFDDQQIGEVTNGEEEPPADELGEGGGAGTMAGTWLKIHVASSCVLGQEQVTHALYLVDIEEDGAGLIEHRRLCAIDMSPVLGFRPVASPQVLQSISFPRLDHAYTPRLLPGGVYASSTEVGLWGVELNEPISEPLPIDADDERVIDADGDGNPGVSLELEGANCFRYMGQRQIVRYFGSLYAPNDIRGASTTTTDVEVYGGSSSVCELAPDVESNDEHSLFRMVRVDGLGGAYDASADGDGLVECDDVTQYLDVIWEPRQPDDELCN